MTDNEDQKTYWSDKAGQSWVALQGVMDATLAPVLDLVLDRAGLQTGQTVLDVGCGAGTSTVQVAQRVGPQGHALGVDISDTLLAKAKDLAKATPHASFLLADAQSYRFETNSFDHLLSRFGVMFFEDTTAAFRNMAKALKPDGKITLGAWGPAPNNPWFMIPARVAAKRLGTPPKTDRTLPGPFAFEDQNRVIEMLENAGLRDVTATTHRLMLTPPAGLEEVADQCFAIGPVSRVVEHFNGTAEDVAAIHEGIIEEFSPFQTPNGIQIPADINLFEARV